MNAIARNAYVAYQKNDVENLQPLELTGRMYQALLQWLHSGGEAIESGNVARKGESLLRAVEIISELQAWLDMEQGGEIAANLNDLYGYLLGELTAVNLRNDGERLARAIKVVEPLAEAWKELAAAGIAADVEKNVGAQDVERAIPSEDVERVQGHLSAVL